jgi:hypothetical protein
MGIPIPRYDGFVLQRGGRNRFGHRERQATLCRAPAGPGVCRYTHRVAISNDRLRAIADGEVRFTYKDCRADSASSIKTMTLSATEFIRRFLLHVLPLGFYRIRYYGFLSPRHEI